MTTTRRRIPSIALAISLGLTTLGLPAAPGWAAPQLLDGSSADAARGGSTFVTFDAFSAGLARATLSAVPGLRSARSGPDAAAFDQMRSYTANLYRGVKVRGSYLSQGSYFDCVVANTQPSARALGLTEVTTTPAPADLPPAGTDAFGNTQRCASGTIPMQRLSLAQMAQAPTLQALLGKPSGQSQQADSPSANEAVGEHRYAYSYQQVTNRGGTANLSVWNPSGYFSLSQMWVVNEVAGNAAATQTVEGGWVRHDAFGPQPTLFIYFTPDGYSTGCYNLRCEAFVQTSNAYGLGQALDISTPGGPLSQVKVKWQYSNSKWVLSVNNVELGYYPKATYKNGPLSTGNANAIKFGGETTLNKLGNWPEMGSGQWPAAGRLRAASQENMYYYNQNGSQTTPNLTTVQEHPNCYKITKPSSTSIIFGGPGGAC